MTKRHKQSHWSPGTQPPTFNPEAKVYDLPKNALECLRVRSFYDKSMIDGYNSKAMADIVVHMCYQDKELSELLSIILAMQIFSSNYKTLPRTLEVSKSFMLIKDEFMRNRIE